MKYDIRILDDYVNRGLLIKTPHCHLPIDIYRYSRKCQYEKSWDDITLNMRGTVIDRNGNIVARTFKKFFNYEEVDKNIIPNEKFEKFEKMDGHFGILYFYANEWHLNTIGSFDSEQGKKGIELLEKYDYEKLDADFTYLFEIIYKEGKIVLDYDKDELVLLGVIHNKDGYELNLYSNNNNLIESYKSLGFNIIKKCGEHTERLDDNLYKFLKNSIPDNSEGFVLKFESGFRLKIKGNKYINLHQRIKDFSNIEIWQVLKNNADISDFLRDVPDEFDNYIRKTIKDLNYHYYSIYSYITKLFDDYMYGKFGNNNKKITKKCFYEWVTKQDKIYQPFLYKMYDNKEYKDAIWDLIKPKYQRPCLK